MSQINRLIPPALLFLGLLLTLGCGDQNPKAVFSADSQQHVAGWMPSSHKTSAEANVQSCEECHGSDLTGGVSGVSCSSCHLGGPGSTHPQAWGQLVGTSHGPYVDGNGNTGCANAVCHGTDLNGIAQSGPSCSSCHLGGTTSIHPLDWTPENLVTKHGDYVKAVNSYASCATIYCHGSNLEGVANSGHSCSSCH